MRVLFGSTCGFGHLQPLLPLARSFRDGGHAVAMVVAPSHRPALEAEGFSVFTAGIELHEVRRRHDPVFQELQQRPPLERRPRAFSTLFGEIQAPARLAGLRQAVAEWRAELVIHESADIAAPLAAAEARIPSVNHGFGQPLPQACLERATEVMAPLWRGLGLAPEPFCGVRRGVTIDVWPPSLVLEPLPSGVRHQLLRPAAPASGRHEIPSGIVRRPDAPLVYVTMGTVFGRVDFFETLLEALAEVDCSVVLTVGHDNDPVALPSVPANATVLRFIEQSLILPHCAAVVSHGGSGSTLG
ncbi:MAG: glycosyltransferase, partial [Gaiella sp.]